MTRLIAFSSLFCLVVACGVNNGAATTSSLDGTSSTVEPTTTTSSTTSTVPSVGEPQTDDYQSDGFPGIGNVAFLTDIEVATHAGYDRVVFEFEGATPEFLIRYVELPIQEGPSGQEVDVAGAAFLEVIMAPATGVDLSGDTPEETYTGPDRFEPEDTPAIEEIVRTEDFESVMAWVFGLAGEYPFSFTTLEEPHRLVIDIHTD